MQTQLSFALVATLCVGCTALAGTAVHRPIHKITIHVPTRLTIQRTSKSLSVSIDNRRSLVSTNIVVASGMAAGVEHSLFVYPVGYSGPLTNVPVFHGFDGSLDFNVGTSILHTSVYGIPVIGKSYVVHMDLVVFETAPKNVVDQVPPISLMMKNKQFHILWRGHITQIVK